MAIKKSQIYSTLWNSCDALRGSMDASQYKDLSLIHIYPEEITENNIDEEIKNVGRRWGMDIEKQYNTCLLYTSLH